MVIELHGEVAGHTDGVRSFHVGVFASPQIVGQPAAWITLSEPGPFRLTVPAGRWYIHAVGGPTDAHGFLSGTVWGSHGGIYGLGSPVEAVAGGPVSALRVHVSALWRDLTHMPHHLQPALTDDQWRAVHTVQRALSENLADTTLGDLGQAAGMVRTRLSALFRRATGLTMEEYRTRLRLEVAKALLFTSASDIVNVALEVGYSTPSQLNRDFQQYLGVPPGEFRRLARSVQVGEPTAKPAYLSGGLRAGLSRALFHRGHRGATIRGNVTYRGRGDGVVIYICAFPGKWPVGYPSAWTSIPRPGPFTLHNVPPGRHYLLVCICSRRMRYPGDFHTAFAYGGYGDMSTVTDTDWGATPLDVLDGDNIGGIFVEVMDGDRAASYARPWYHFFMPDGR